MKKRFVLSTDAIPSRLPLWSTATAWLLCDRFQAAGWVWGMVGTVFAIGWVAIITRMFLEEKVDPFNETDAHGSTKASSRWKERLEQMKKSN